MKNFEENEQQHIGRFSFRHRGGSAKTGDGKKSGRLKTVRAFVRGHMIRLSVIAVVILGAISIFLIYHQAMSSLKDTCDETTTAYSKAVAAEIEKYQTMVTSISTDGRITPDMSVAELDAIRDEYVKKFNAVDALFVLSNGLAFDDASIDLSSRDYFTHAMDGETYVSSPLASKKTGKVLCYISTKINNGTGFDGVVALAIGISDFNSIVSDIQIGETGSAIIINKEGTIVASANENDVTSFTNYLTLAKTDSSAEAYAQATQQMLKEKNGSLSVSGNFIDYTEISGTDGWILFTSVPKSEMLSSLKLGIVVVVLAVLLATFSAAVASRRASGLIAAPLAVSMGHLNDISMGNLKNYEPERANLDELNTLSQKLQLTVFYLNNYISDINSTLTALSQKNLNISVTEEYVGDFSRIKDSMNLIIDSLNSTIAAIGKESAKVLNVSEQVSSSSQALAQGATEQASSVEEMLSTVNSIADQAVQTAQEATNASKMSAEVRQQIEQGNTQMKELLDAMSRITSTSNQVAKVNKMIEDIAFQTNILALNAAVEAARAGAAGKGFAVVANEVKTLAEKSAAAAENTSSLIQNTLDAISGGTEITSQTAEILGAVVGSVDDMAQTISHISVASENQSEAIQQVVQGLDQISTVVQTNSASAEESAAISHELAESAVNLQKMVAEFKLR